MTSGDEKNSPVDLGLKALLSASEHSPMPSQELDSASKNHGSESAPHEVVAEAQSEYERLAGEHRWADIIKSAEAALAQHDEPEARLWWIRGHLEGFSMPVSFLSAPLESVCHSIAAEVPSPRIVALLRETGRTVMKRLFEVGDKDHMVSLQRALEKAGVYEEERYRRRTHGKPGTVPQDGANVLQAASPGIGAVIGEASGAVDAKANSRRYKAFLAALLVPLTAAVGYYAITLSQPYFQPIAVLADEDFMVDPVPLELAAPLLDHRDAVGSLSALFYSINGTSLDGVSDKEAVVPNPAVVEATTPEPSLQQSTGTVSSSDTSNSQKTPPNKEEKRAGEASPPAPTASKRKEKTSTKEKIDTQGPVEGPEFKDRARRERLPDRRDEPLIMEQRTNEFNGEFDGSGVYRVIASTKVLSAPSYSGRVVGVLEPNDRVYVEARLGRWLRLRSRKGKGGFVLAEDVAGREQDGDNLGSDRFNDRSR